MDKNYDTERFTKFMDKKKPYQPVDVNLYSWAELESYVVEFQN